MGSPSPAHLISDKLCDVDRAVNVPPTRSRCHALPATLVPWRSSPRTGSRRRKASVKASVRVKRSILEVIASGEFSVGADLPSEAQLAERFASSRLTLRESVSALASAGVIEVRQGRRNRIAPVSDWSVLDPEVVAVRTRLTGDSRQIVGDLMEARRVLEVGIVRLAAERISDKQISELENALSKMHCELDGDVEKSARADIEFHEVIGMAAGNAYLKGAFHPLHQMLLAVRIRTSSSRKVRADAIAWHKQILNALRARDPEAATQAMSGHMDQTAAATSGVKLDDPDEKCARKN